MTRPEPYPYFVAVALTLCVAISAWCGVRVYRTLVPAPADLVAVCIEGDVPACQQLNERAAAQCRADPGACYGMGRIYETGRGLPARNLPLACTCYARACRAGSAAGCAARGRLGCGATP